MTNGSGDRQLSSREVSDEALRWIMRLNSGEATLQDHAAFAAWRALDPDHEQAAREAEEIWGSATDLRQDPETGAVLHHDNPRGPSRRKLLGLAGGAIATSSLGWAALGGRRAFADYSTNVAQIDEIRLSDGSRVVLNARSAINVAFAPDSRRIRLLEGEALFEVVADTSRPFRVTTNAVEVTALGTIFNVSARQPEDGVAVAVAEHAVRLRSISGQFLDLRQAQEAIISDAGTIGPITAVEPRNVTSWRQGRFVAENRRLADVVAALKPYYPGWIILRGDAAAFRVSVVLDLRQPILSLDILARTLPISVTHLSPYLTVISSR